MLDYKFNPNYCTKCGEFKFNSSHKCPPLWYCIYPDEHFDKPDIPDFIYMQENGKRIYASDMIEASKKFAEVYQAESGWYPSEMEVMLMKDSPDRYQFTIYKIIVNQEPVPSYWVDQSPQVVLFGGMDLGVEAEDVTKD